MVGSLLGKSAAMLDVVRRIAPAARVDSPVLIWGEKGTGKKLVAEVIHRQSRRGWGPLVTVRAEYASASQLEKELFGAADQLGALAAAQGGTLLIDGITEIPRTAQARLLRAVESKRLAEVRDPAGHPIDFRLMATARRRLSECVQRGTIREDLYYQLAVVTIHVPSLRERKEDIPLLVQQMLGELSAACGRPVPHVEPDLMRYFVQCPWLGNGPELRNCLKTMFEAGESGVLRMNHLPGSAQRRQRSGTFVRHGKPRHMKI